MGYVSKTLAEGEHILERARFNWTHHFELWFWLFFSCVLVVVFTVFTFTKGVVGNPLMIIGWVCALTALILVIGWSIMHAIILTTTEIIVTTFRFVYKTGLIARNTKEVSLNKIEEIALEQSVWGRIWCYGKLTLRGTGVGVIELPNLDNPIGLRRVIETAKAELRLGAPQSGHIFDPD